MARNTKHEFEADVEIDVPEFTDYIEPEGDGETVSLGESTVETVVEGDEPEEKPEPEIDLDPFKASVEVALAERDTSTGTLPEAQVDLVRAEYAKLTGTKAKNLAKAFLQSELKRYMEVPDVPPARSIMTLQEKATISGRATTPAAERKPVDPTEAYAEGLAALTLAFYLASSIAPEGVDLEKAKAAATAKADENFVTATEVFNSEKHETEDKLIAKAVKLAVVKLTTKRTSGGKGGGSTFTGKRRDIGQHIVEAIAGVPAGTFVSLGDIRKFKSEEYGEDTPSAGALSNRLEPTNGAVCTVPGVQVARQFVDGKEKLGVVVQ